MEYNAKTPKHTLYASGIESRLSESPQARRSRDPLITCHSHFTYFSFFLHSRFLRSASSYSHLQGYPCQLRVHRAREKLYSHAGIHLRRGRSKQNPEHVLPTTAVQDRKETSMVMVVSNLLGATLNTLLSILRLVFTLITRPAPLTMYPIMAPHPMHIFQRLKPNLEYSIGTSETMLLPFKIATSPVPTRTCHFHLRQSTMSLRI